MKLIGVINEDPFDPLSWSGSARYFFGALRQEGVLVDAHDVNMSSLEDYGFRLLNAKWPISSWRETYHLDTRRFERLSRIAARRLKPDTVADGFLQIGAWYDFAGRVGKPCFSYHDGNLALRVRSGGVSLPANHRAVLKAMQWERSVYAKLSGLFTMSKWLASSFISDFGVPPDKVHVVGAGLNFDSIPPPNAVREHPPHFLMVGRDFQRKGGYVLLEAFAIVRKQCPLAELTIVGPTLSSPPPGVRCLGYLSKANPEHVQMLQEAYASAGIYVLPSLYEPFGISLLEAMSNSLPCIATNHCAMPEIVLDGITGLIVEPGSAESLAAGMLKLAKSPDFARKCGAAGRERLLSEYTWDVVAKKIREVTDDFAKQRS